MMLTVTTAAAAWFAFAVAAAVPARSSADMPPMIVTVMPAAGLSPRLLAAVLSEAAAIWRPGGVSFVWRHASQPAPSSSPAQSGSYAPNTLRLTIGDNRGVAGEGRLPLGWIAFSDTAMPEPEIYLSFANATALMEIARGVVGIIDQMPIAQRETLLARAMGRALAHELGHYLLASKIHTPRGLMKANLTAVELFMPDANGLRIDAAQRRAVAERLRGEPLVASR